MLQTLAEASWKEDKTVEIQVKLFQIGNPIILSVT